MTKEYITKLNEIVDDFECYCFDPSDPELRDKFNQLKGYLSALETLIK